MSLNFANALGELEEMFPNHSRETILATFEKCRFDLGLTISTLLVPSESQRPAFQRGSPSGGSAAIYNRFQPTRPPNNPPPAAPKEKQTKSHILPPDFLAWPANAHWVPVCRDSNDSFIFSPDFFDNSDLSAYDDSSRLGSMTKLQNEKIGSGWEQFKAKMSDYKPL